MARVPSLGLATSLLLLIEKSFVHCGAFADGLRIGPEALPAACSGLQSIIQELSEAEEEHRLEPWPGKPDLAATLRACDALLRLHQEATQAGKADATTSSQRSAWAGEDSRIRQLHQELYSLVRQLCRHLQVPIAHQIIISKNAAEALLNEAFASLQDKEPESALTESESGARKPRALSFPTADVRSQLVEAEDLRETVKRVEDRVHVHDLGVKGKMRAEAPIHTDFEVLRGHCDNLIHVLSLLAQAAEQKITPGLLTGLRTYSVTSFSEFGDEHPLRRKDTIISQVDSIFSHTSSTSAATTVTIRPQEAPKTMQAFPQIELPPSVMSITKLKKKITVLAPIPGGPWECRAVLQYKGDKVEAVVLETTKKKSSRIVHRVTNDNVLPETSYPLPGEPKYRLTFKEPLDVTVSIFQKQKQLSDSLEYVFEAEDDYNAFQEIFFRHRLVGSMNINKAKSNLGLLATLRNIRIWSELEVVGSDELLLTVFCNAVEKGPKENITFKLSSFTGVAKARRSKDSIITLEFDPPVQGHEWLELQFALPVDKEKFERFWKLPDEEHRRRSISVSQLQARK